MKPAQVTCAGSYIEDGRSTVVERTLCWPRHGSRYTIVPYHRGRLESEPDGAALSLNRMVRPTLTVRTTGLGRENTRVLRRAEYHQGQHRTEPLAAPHRASLQKVTTLIRRRCPWTFCAMLS